MTAPVVEGALRTQVVARMIHGHTHRPAHHAIVVDGMLRERVVLADWDDRGHYVAIDAAGIHVHQIDG